MGTYIFSEKNGSATITISADSWEDAITQLRDITSIDFRYEPDLYEED